jgi:hypothetical protein
MSVWRYNAATYDHNDYMTHLPVIGVWPHSLGMLVFPVPATIFGLPISFLICDATIEKTSTVNLVSGEYERGSSRLKRG